MTPPSSGKKLDAPHLATARTQATHLTSELRGAAEGMTVVLDCRHTAVSGLAFADQLVRRVLVEECAETLRVENCRDELFAKYLMAAARVHGVQDRVVVTSVKGQNA